MNINWLIFLLSAYYYFSKMYPFNQRGSGNNPIPQGPCPLSLQEIYLLLPRELQNHPEVVKRVKQLTTMNSNMHYSLCITEANAWETQTHYTSETQPTEPVQFPELTQAESTYKQKIITTMCADNELTAYCQAYTNDTMLNSIEVDKANSVEVRWAEIRKNRSDALTRHNRGCDIWQEHTYTLFNQAQALLNNYSMQSTDFLTCFGNQIQQVIHKEFVDIVHDTAGWEFKQGGHSSDREGVAATLMRFVKTGQLYNRNGHLGKAFSCADFCWGLLDCSIAIDKFAFELTTATIKGVARGGVNIFFKVIQPIRTASDIWCEIVHLGALAREHLRYAHDQRQLAFKRMRVQINKDEQGLTAGTITQWDLVRRSIANFQNVGSQTIEQVNIALNQTLQNIDREMVLLGAEKIAELGTEIFLTAKATNAISTVFKNGSTTLGDIIDAGGGTGKFHNLPLTGGTLQAHVAYESIIASETAEVVQISDAFVADALNATAKIVPSIVTPTGNKSEILNNNEENIPQTKLNNKNTRNWSNDESFQKLEELNTPATRNNVKLTGLEYDELLLAHNLFKDVPGFLDKAGPFQNVIRHCLTNEIESWNTIKGYSFEIKTALKLEAQNFKVLEFGKKINSRDIDIVTEGLWVECKDWSWNYVDKARLEKFFSSVGQIKKYATAANVDYVVASNGSLPTEIKNWLISKNIQFFEI